MIDHAYEPYLNPKVNPGCVRCPYAEADHPKVDPDIPVLRHIDWGKLVEHGRQTKVYG